MKKITVLLIISICSVSWANAQSKKQDSIRTKYTQEFILNPLPFFVGGFEVGYGTVTPKSLKRFTIGYYFSEPAPSYGGEFSNMEGIRIDLQYLHLKPMDGGMRFYFGGYFNYKAISMDKEDGIVVTTGDPKIEKVSGSAIGVGFMIGMRTFLEDNFFVDMYAGGGPTISLNRAHEEDVHISIVNPYRRSINPRIGLSVGIAF